VELWSRVLRNRVVWSRVELCSVELLSCVVWSYGVV
jgi:hypothetical protein